LELVEKPASLRRGLRPAAMAATLWAVTRVEKPASLRRGLRRGAVARFRATSQLVEKPASLRRGLRLKKILPGIDLTAGLKNPPRSEED